MQCWWLLAKSRIRYLFGLVLLGVARGEKTFSIHLHGFDIRSCLTRRGCQALHLQKWLDVSHFWLVGAVSHCLALRGQDTCSFPLGILRFLDSYNTRPGLYSHTLQGFNKKEGRIGRNAHWEEERGLTLSHRMYTSFIPSATGSRSLMPNFLSVTLTSGTTSQPITEEIVVNLTTEEEQHDTDLQILA